MAYTPYVKEWLRKWVSATPTGGPGTQFGDKRTGTKTTKPSPLKPLAYHRAFGSYQGFYVLSQFEQTSSSCVPALSTSTQFPSGRLFEDYYGLVPLATNRSRSSFVSLLRDEEEASLGAAIGEGKSSLLMIAKRSAQIYLSFKAVKAGKFKEAARLLAVPLPVKFRGNRAHRRKIIRSGATAGSLWLEYHFGWSPLLRDIHGAIKSLESPFDAKKVSSTGSASHLIPNWERTVDGIYQKVWMKGLVRTRVGIKADVRLVNPNLARASQLGLVNPATVAWELVPFSFFVDWFLPVGSFLDSFLDTVGWEFRNVTTSVKSEWWGEAKKRGQQGRTDPRHIEYVQTGGYGLDFRRSVGGYTLPAYSLKPTRLSGLSVTRAASAVAILSQFLNRSR